MHNYIGRALLYMYHFKGKSNQAQHRIRLVCTYNLLKSFGAITFISLA